MQAFISSYCDLSLIKSVSGRENQIKQRYKNREEKNLLPFHIIKAASEGDVLAINTVLKHCEGYIITLSTRKMYDEGGRLHYCVDETLRRRLETKLITKILAFEAV